MLNKSSGKRNTKKTIPWYNKIKLLKNKWKRRKSLKRQRKKIQYMQNNKDKNDRFQLRSENSSIFVKPERKKKNH